jgi:hypothetical protein
MKFSNQVPAVRRELPRQADWANPIARMSASSERTLRENKSLTPSDTPPTARRSPAIIKMGGRAAQLFLVL